MQRCWALTKHQAEALKINTQYLPEKHGELISAYLGESNVVMCIYQGLTSDAPQQYQMLAIRGREHQELAAIFRVGLVAPQGITEKLEEKFRGVNQADCKSVGTDSF